MCGKIVGDLIYIHKSAVDQLPEKLFNTYHTHHKAFINSDLKDFDYQIVVVGKDSVQFVQCIDWDLTYEPVVGDRINVSYAIPENETKGEWLITLRKGDVNNPQIFHHRNLFVNESYDGFDYEDDCYRSEQIHQAIDKEILRGCTKRDISVRMGRQNWWDEFCAKHGL